MADRRPDVGANDVAAEQADRGVVGDRNDIVGDAQQRVFFLIDPAREIGVAQEGKRRSFGGRLSCRPPIGGSRGEGAVYREGGQKSCDRHHRDHQRVTARQCGKDRRNGDQRQCDDKAGQSIEHARLASHKAGDRRKPLYRR